MGQTNDPDPQLIEGIEVSEAALKRIGIQQADNDRGATRFLGCLDVVGGGGQHEVLPVTVRSQPDREGFALRLGKGGGDRFGGLRPLGHEYGNDLRIDLSCFQARGRDLVVIGSRDVPRSPVVGRRQVGVRVNHRRPLMHTLDSSFLGIQLHASSGSCKGASQQSNRWHKNMTRPTQQPDALRAKDVKPSTGINMCALAAFPDHGGRVIAGWRGRVITSSGPINQSGTTGPNSNAVARQLNSQAAA